MGGSEQVEDQPERDGGCADGPSPILRPTAADLLPALALQEAMTPRQLRALRTASTRLCAVVVVAPSIEWIGPLARAGRALSPWDAVVAPIDVRYAKKEDGARKIAEALALGKRVLGVSHDPGRTLPSCLVSGADLTINVAPPDDGVVARLIFAVTGRRARGLPAGVALGLDHIEIVSAVRQGSSAADCMRRLVAAARSKSVVDPALASSPTLDRLHGYGAAMTWCEDLVADLNGWKCGTAPFPPNARVILSGPPGTGKSQLVRSLAATAKLPLLASSVGAWFTDSSGALDGVVKQIARLWETARAIRPCVVFLDELDGLPNRATMDARGRDWWTPVVNYMLTSLDSAVSGTTKDLIIVGATNHPEHLDAALIRPGRLERIIHVGYPETAAEREGMFRTHLDGMLDGVDIAAAANVSSGLSGADIMAAVRNARKRARLAGRDMALGDLMSELAPPTSRSAADDRRVAVHEAGHALAACTLGCHLDSVSVIERPGRGGDVAYSPAGMPKFPTRADIERFVVVALAGGAAEEALLGARSSGQGGADRSDIGQATGMIAALHASFGLGDTHAYRTHPDGALRLLATDIVLRRAVETDMARLHGVARELVAERLPAVEWLAAALLDARFMTGDEIRAGLDRFQATGRSPERHTGGGDSVVHVEKVGSSAPSGAVRDRTGHELWVTPIRQASRRSIPPDPKRAPDRARRPSSVQVSRPTERAVKSARPRMRRAEPDTG